MPVKSHQSLSWGRRYSLLEPKKDCCLAEHTHKICVLGWATAFCCERCRSILFKFQCCLVSAALKSYSEHQSISIWLLVGNLTLVILFKSYEVHFTRPSQFIPCSSYSKLSCLCQEKITLHLLDILNT